MRQRFAAAGRPDDEAEAAATMIAEFFRTSAMRLGTSVDALVDRFGLPEVHRGDVADQGAALFQPAYHGTPHIFDKFSLDAIGTGEGAQAYGHGLYFASKKAVAQHYREALAGRPRVEMGGRPLTEYLRPQSSEMNAELRQWANENLGAIELEMPAIYQKTGVNAERWAKWIEDYTPHALQQVGRFLADAIYADPDVDKALKAIVEGQNKLLAEAETESMSRNRLRLNAAVAQALIDKKLVAAETPGRLLHVDVPHNDELMNWDAPLSEQPPKVKAALEKLGIKEPPKPAPIKDVELRSIVNRAIRQNDGEADGEAVELIIDNDQALYTAAESWAKRDPEAQGVLDEYGPGRAIRWMAREWFEAAEAAKNFTGQKAYDGLVQEIGASPEMGRTILTSASAEASRRLREAGIPGHRYIGHESQSENYVIYDDSRVNVVDFEQPNRGAIQFGDDGRSIISLFETADASTALHETGHYFLSMFKSMAEAPDAPDAMRGDWAVVKSWWDANAEAVAADAPSEVTAADVRAVLDTGTSGDRIKDLAINVGLQEQWARGFEAYLREGVAPSEGLRGIFAQFKAWLTSIYRKAVDLNVNLSPEIRGVFDRLLMPEPRQMALDTSPPRPEPIPEGYDAAAARVGKPEALRDVAEQYGVDAKTGESQELADIAQMRDEGRLTPEDEAELALAEQDFHNAEAWEAAMKIAAVCVV